MLIFPKTTTAREVQRNYKRLFEQVKRTKEPVIVMRRNRPEVAIVDVKKLEELEAMFSILRSLKQIKEGKAKILSSLQDLD